MIAASGNDDTFLTAFDPDTPVLVVNATNEVGDIARFSNFGDPRAVSAAGARIISTAPTHPTTIWPEGTDGYEYLDGTSMASPHAAGIAALLVRAGESPEDIYDLLVETAVNPDGNPLLGAGIIQADDATDQSQTRTVVLWSIVVIIVVGVALIAWERHRNA